MKRLVGLVFVSAVFFVLLWIYEAFPDQRGILIFGSIIGATIAGRGSNAQGDAS